MFLLAYSAELIRCQLHGDLPQRDIQNLRLSNLGNQQEYFYQRFPNLNAKNRRQIDDIGVTASQRNQNAWQDRLINPNSIQYSNFGAKRIFDVRRRLVSDEPQGRRQLGDVDLRDLYVELVPNLRQD